MLNFFILISCTKKSSRIVALRFLHLTLFHQFANLGQCSFIHPFNTHLLSFFLFYFWKYSWFTILWQFCCTATWPSHIYIYIHIYSLSYIISSNGLFQETGYSSLCYTAGPHCLSTLKVIVCFYWCQTPSPSHSLPFPFGNCMSVLLCLWISFCFVGGFVCALF